MYKTLLKKMGYLPCQLVTANILWTVNSKTQSKAPKNPSVNFVSLFQHGVSSLHISLTQGEKQGEKERSPESWIRGHHLQRTKERGVGQISLSIFLSLSAHTVCHRENECDTKNTFFLSARKRVFPKACHQQDPVNLLVGNEPQTRLVWKR